MREQNDFGICVCRKRCFGHHTVIYVNWCMEMLVISTLSTPSLPKVQPNFLLDILIFCVYRYFSRFREPYTVGLLSPICKITHDIVGKWIFHRYNDINLSTAHLYQYNDTIDLSSAYLYTTCHLWREWRGKLTSNTNMELVYGSTAYNAFFTFVFKYNDLRFLTLDE